MLKNRIERAVLRWVEIAAARPRRAVALVVLATLLGLVIAAFGLRVNSDSSRMLSADLPFQQRNVALEDAFPDVKKSLVVVVRSDVADAADFATLALTQAIDARGEEAGRVFAPSVDPFFRANGLLYAPTDEVASRLSALSNMAGVLARLRQDQSLPTYLSALAGAQTALEKGGQDTGRLDAVYLETAKVLDAASRGIFEPYSWRAAAGMEAERAEGAPATRLVYVTPKLDYSRLQPAKTSLEAVRAAIVAAETSLPPEIAGRVTFGLTGDPAMRSEELSSVTEGMALSVVVSLSVVAFLLFAAFRSWRVAALAMSGLVPTLAITAGFAALAVGELNLISIAFAVLMIGMGLDFAIHFLAHLREKRLGRLGAQGALRGTAEALGAPMALGAATTALTFFAFAPTEFVGMAQLGLIGGVGVMIAFAVTLTLTPALVAMAPLVFASRATQPPAIARKLSSKTRRTAAAAIAALGLLAIVPASMARFDADPVNLRNPDSPSVVALDQLWSAPGAAPYRLSLVLPPAEASSPEITALAERLEAAPEVRSVTRPLDLVPKDQFAKLDEIDLVAPSILYALEGEGIDFGVPPTALPELLSRAEGPGAAALLEAMTRFDAQPGARAIAERALFFFFPQLLEEIDDPLSAGEVAFEDLPEALVDRFVAADGRHRIDIAPAEDLRDPAARMAFLDRVTEIAPEVAGPPLQIERAADTVASAMIFATLLSAVLVAGLTWATLRSVGRTLAVLVPLGLAAAATAGISTLINQPFNFANVIVLPLLLGLGVDGGVHMAMRRGRMMETPNRAPNRGGRRAPESDVLATSTPRAVFFSALTTAAAFGSLALSPHPGTASMGLMLGIALLCAVVFVIVLTPALVELAERPARMRAVLANAADADRI